MDTRCLLLYLCNGARWTRSVTSTTSYVCVVYDFQMLKHDITILTRYSLTHSITCATPSMPALLIKAKLMPNSAFQVLTCCSMSLRIFNWTINQCKCNTIRSLFTFSGSVNADGVGPIIASTSVKYKLPVTFPDELIVGCRVREMGDDYTGIA